MKAKEFWDAGKLSAAVSELSEQVKRAPSDSSLRTFLFEALCFSGDFERAERQLGVLGHQNESAAIGVEVYRSILRAESARRRFFEDGLRPQFLFEPPPYVQFHLDAANRLRQNDPIGAKTLLDRSISSRETVRGYLAGHEFSTFRDSDDLLAPVFEVFAKGSYVWLPCEQARKITIRKPKYLRDLMWIPATIEAGEGPPGEVVLPVLYHGSAHEEDDRIKLGRMTDWKSPGEGLARGVGQHTFLVDNEDRAILEVGELEFGAKLD